LISQGSQNANDPLRYLDAGAVESAYRGLSPQCDRVVVEMGRLLQRAAESCVPAVQVKGRVKRLPSLMDKLQRKFTSEELLEPLPALRQLADLMALRAVCPFLEDVDLVVDAARSVFEIQEVEQKGEGRSFAEFGYASTHLQVSLPYELQREFPTLSEFRVEIQVRTILQDAWAEVEHELIYKVGAHPLNQQIRRKLAALNANLVLSDTIFQEIRDYQKSNISDLARARENHLEHSTGEHPLYTAPGENAPRPRRPSQGDVEKLLKKGLNAQIAGEMEDAVRIYTALLEHSLDNFTLSVVLNHRGMANESLEENADALEDFLRAREADPNNARARINLALAWRRQGRLAEAESEFQEVLSFKPNSAHAHYGLGLVQSDRGEIPEAVVSCERALKLSHSFTQAQQLLDELLDQTRRESGGGS
jgi:putative GTP pyrophosphokinase